MRKQKEQGVFSRKNMIGMFIVLIMVMSGIGYMVIQDTGSSTNFDYNGYRFVSQGYNAWDVLIGEQRIRFTYHPTDAERINISPEVIDYLLSTKVMYLTFDPGDRYVQDIELARVELEQQLPAYLKMHAVTGIANVTDAYASFSKVDCSNATIFIPVLYFRTSETANQSSIAAQGGCIVLEATNGAEIPLLKDRLLYGLLKVIK